MGELFDFAHPVNGNYAINEIAPSAFNRAILTGLVCNVSANLATSITVRASLSSEYMANHIRRWNMEVHHQRIALHHNGRCFHSADSR